MARILLIEEEQNAAEVASVICRADGHDCATVSSFVAALHRLESEPFDVVILDHSRPQAIEHDFIATLRQHERTRDLPLILLAPLPEAERRKLEKSGVTRALPKPFSIQMLQNMLRQILKGHPTRSGQEV